MKHVHSEPNELLPVGEYYLNLEELIELEEWLDENWWKVEDKENGAMFVPQCKIKVSALNSHVAKILVHN